MLCLGDCTPACAAGEGLLAPALPGEGQRESLFHPHRSEPRGHFLTSGSSSSPTGTTATRASLGGASRTSLCQHWEGNTFLLAAPHSVHRPPHALRQLCQTRGSRGAAGHGPLQEQMLNHKKGTLSLLHSQPCVPDSGLFNCSGTCLSNLTFPTRALAAQPGRAAAPILPSSPAEAFCWPANICPLPSQPEILFTTFSAKSLLCSLSLHPLL